MGAGTNGLLLAENLLLVFGMALFWKQVNNNPTFFKKKNFVHLGSRIPTDGIVFRSNMVISGNFNVL
jgi:hypothetical protein